MRHSISRFLARLSFVAALLVVLCSCDRSVPDKLQGYIEGEFVYVASPLGGTLQSLHVSRGQQVRAGEALFALDSTPEKTVLSQAQAAIAYSQSEFERQDKLMRSGGSPKGEFERARSLRDQDRERLVKAQWDLDQKSQLAPKAGFVFDTLYREGEWVAAGRPVVVVLPPENIKARSFVPEPDIGSVHVGDGVKVFVDKIEAPFLGKINYISAHAEFTPPVIYSRESRQKLVFMIEITFDPATAAKLHPGQPVDVQLGH